MRRRRHPAPRPRRQIDARAQIPRILIVCEGERTEKLYFEAFSASSVRVEGTGFNTRSLVHEAMRLSSKFDYDQVWCVFDKDDFSAADFQGAIELARKQPNFHVAYTNQAFELWYLLHYDYHTSALSRTQYGDKLSDRIGRKYEKNDPDLFALLLSRQDDAIRNAESVLASYDPHVPHEDNPCTTVHLLVKELRKFARP